MSHHNTGNKRDREAKRDRRKRDKADRLQRNRDEAARQKPDGGDSDGVEALGSQLGPRLDLGDVVVSGPGGAERGPVIPAKLFVSGLDVDTTSSELRIAFSNFGKVIDAEVVRDRSNGRSRGFGYVTFEKWADADEAIKRMHGLELDGRPLKVNRADSISR
jgi:hypothetical protein